MSLRPNFKLLFGCVFVAGDETSSAEIQVLLMLEGPLQYQGNIRGSGNERLARSLAVGVADGIRPDG